MYQQILKYFFGAKPDKCQALAPKLRDVMVSLENHVKYLIFEFPVYCCKIEQKKICYSFLKNYENVETIFKIFFFGTKSDKCQTFAPKLLDIIVCLENNVKYPNFKFPV
jgi:hypothetical protein